MMENVKYPIGLQNFAKLRQGGYLYVDKTSYISNLIETGNYVFLSRPRRFGKSLLISTIEAYFSGERQLFEGLAIDRLRPEPWEKFPVVHLDLSGENYNSVEALESSLDYFIAEQQQKFGVEIEADTISQKFQSLVKGIYFKYKKEVVILIDEYDNPLTSAINNPELQTEFREILYGFYSSLKKLDPYIRFCMITGITKYGHLSVFSGLNNLEDISLSDEYAGICGITDAELDENFQYGIKALATKLSISESETKARLKDYYDGYHFSAAMLDIYNPFSVLSALSAKKISDYWFRSGVPTILMKLLNRESLDVSRINGSLASESSLYTISADSVNPIALFYQTGYLTIKAWNEADQLFTLGYPNKEIETGFYKSVLKVYGGDDDPGILISKLKNSLQDGRPEEFIKELRVFFADVPYDLRKNLQGYENYYHSLFYVLVKVIGLDVKAEYHTSEGSIDMVVETADYTYIIELKINGKAEDAMEQINQKSYCIAFEASGKTIIKIGLGFAERTHTIDSYIIE